MTLRIGCQDRPFRFVFVGAGAASLTLADELIRRGVPGCEIAVFERAECLALDRTFCTFADSSLLEALPIQARWDRWSVRSSEGVVNHQASERAYRQLDLVQWREQVLQRLTTHGATLAFGVDVEAVEPALVGATVRSSIGAVYARRVFDSRPALPSEESWLQSFVGLEVRTLVPAFDTSTVTLMDFRVVQLGLGTFVYVLPYARDRALVEATTIDRRAIPEFEHELVARRYLTDSLCVPSTEFRVERREQSALVMDPGFEELLDRGPVTRIGAAGGAIRPATGYGFAANLRFAHEFAPRLASNHRALRPRYHRAALRQLDRLFLNHLEERGRTAAQVFFRFAQKVPPDRFARFLADDPTAMDLIGVARSLPPAPILRTAVKAWRRGLKVS